MFSSSAENGRKEYDYNRKRTCKVNVVYTFTEVIFKVIALQWSNGEQ